MFWNRNYKLKTPNMVIHYRAMTEVDLLGADSYAPIFLIEKECSPIGSLIEEHEKENEEQDNFAFKKHIVKCCVTRVKSRSKKFTSKDIAENLEDENIVNMLFPFILARSIKRVFKVSRKKAISIYELYKGSNYAREYFEIPLSKIEEYSFNALVHNAGVQEEIRRQKEAQIKAKAKRNG